MIRINLLPTRDEQRTQQARIQLFIFVGILILEVAVLALVYMDQSSVLEKLKGEVAQNQTEVKKAKKEVKDADELKAQAETLSKQLEVLDELELKRTGPVRVLDELQLILSPPRNEEDRFAQLEKNWNVEWNAKRLWLGKLVEKNGSFEMTGEAVNADDVAEFLQRLNTAKHFQNIKLDVVETKSKARSRGSTGPQLRLVSFRLEGDLSYSGAKVAPNKGKKRRK